MARLMSSTLSHALTVVIAERRNNITRVGVMINTVIHSFPTTPTAMPIQVLSPTMNTETRAIMSAIGGHKKNEPNIEISN